MKEGELLSKLNKKDLDELKAKLTSLQRECKLILRKGKVCSCCDKDEKGEFDNRMEQVHLDIKLNNRCRLVLLAVERALSKINSPDQHDCAYGECESCGDMIDLKRLESKPFAAYCIECKVELERQRSLRGEPQEDFI